MLRNRRCCSHFCKSERKRGIKLVFDDEIVGLDGNCISEKMVKHFQQKGKRGHTFDNHYFVEWKYGKPGDKKARNIELAKAYEQTSPSGQWL